MFKQRPPEDGKVQHLADRYSDNSYQDPETGEWYLGDSNGTAIREVQPGRGYAFSANEDIRYPNTLTLAQQAAGFKIRYIAKLDFSQNLPIRIIDEDAGDNTCRMLLWLNYNGATNLNLYDDTDTSVGIASSGIVLQTNTVYDVTFTINGINQGDINTVDVNGTRYSFEVQTQLGARTVEKTHFRSGSYSNNTFGHGNLYFLEISDLKGKVLQQYKCEESDGIVSYDSSGNNHHGIIDLNGTSTTTFHTTDSNVPSFQNTGGFGGKYVYEWSSAKGNMQELIDGGTLTSATAELDGSGRLKITPTTDGAAINVLNYTIYGASAPKKGAKAKFSFDIADSINTDGLVNRYLNGVSHQWFSIGPGTGYSKEDQTIDLIDSAGTYSFRVGLTQGGTTSEYMTYDNIKLEFFDYIPVDNSNKTKDILGNDLTNNQIGQVAFNTQVEGSSVGYGDGTLYGEIGNPASLELQNFEVEVEGKFGTIPPLGTSFGAMFSVSMNNLGLGGNGWAIITSGSSGALYYSACYDNGATVDRDSTGSYTFGSSWMKYRVKRYNGTVYVYAYDELIEQESHNDIKFGSVTSHSSIYKYQTSSADTFEGFIGKIRYWELNTSGERINELSHYIFSETNGSIVHNVAENAPSNSDITWNLNGSANGTQWDITNEQTPYNLIEGFTNYDRFNITNAGAGYFYMQLNGSTVVTGDEWTFAIRVKSSNSPAGTHHLCKSDVAGFNNSIRVGTSNVIYINGSGSQTVISGNYSHNEFHDIIIRSIGTTIFCYVDGIRKSANQSGTL